MTYYRNYNIEGYEKLEWSFKYLASHTQKKGTSPHKNMILHTLDPHCITSNIYSVETEHIFYNNKLLLLYFKKIKINKH